ncbi:hypothetical protein DFR29_101424 [Tahibacter aquaticus]|uniref:Uncharacterized protein n=1 Tax=Tahibacter aquaticus TaxID=520092 RepID=A0A4R6ZA35_9GAMM|nr:hypothetical protein [Tahibacter aquaticus]TDR48800.1 hypothetical protein DFR29_101424 [Tahibacter aquaticus]
MAAAPANFGGDTAAARSATQAIASWRIRWYWRWQAWRLRQVRAQESGHGVACYDSLHALDQLGYLGQFCALHQELMRQARLPGLDAPAAFSRRLARELNGHCLAALLGTPDGNVAGYAWGRVGGLAEALQHYQQVQALGHLRSDEWLALEQRAAALVGEAPLLALNGVGLAQRYRHGFAPLKHLLKPLLDLARQHGASRAIFWVPRNGSLTSLALGLGAEAVLETPRIACFVLADLRPLGRIFAALPASGIAELLARVAPPRPPARAAPRLAVVKPLPKPPRNDAAA